MDIAERLNRFTEPVDVSRCTIFEEAYLLGAREFRSIIYELSLFSVEELNEVFGETVSNIKDVISLFTYEELITRIKNYHDSKVEDEVLTLLNKYGKKGILTALDNLTKCIEE